MENKLINELQRRHVASATDLQQALGVSQPTLSRLIGKLSDQVVLMGKARASRYALLRNLRGFGTEFPMYMVSSIGELAEIGSLKSISGGRWYGSDPLMGAERLFDGFPYFLSDARPQGFMGRAFPKQHPDLQLPERIADWSDDDAMVAIIHCGMDAIGNLIVGNESMRAFLTHVAHPIQGINETERVNAYSRLAEAALHGDPAGSSAGGEQPKFAATLATDTGNRHVLVKFSPADDSEVSQRWRDLLIAEHLAGISLGMASNGVPVASSRLIETDSRVFLEVTRFDRVGEHGRIGVISLGSMDDEHYGRRDNWLAAADRLERDAWLNAHDAEAIRVGYEFGGLIGNSDRHFGNVSLLIGASGRLSLAPFYDQLPMMYAPSSGQLVTREFSVKVPESGGFRAWETALPLAEYFWQRVAEYPSISKSFREVAKGNAMALHRESRLIAKVITVGKHEHLSAHSPS